MAAGQPIASTCIIVGADTAPAERGLDRLTGYLKAAEKEVRRLNDTGQSDRLVSSTRDMVAQVKALPRGYADATREVRKLADADRQRRRLEGRPVPVLGGEGDGGRGSGPATHPHRGGVGALVKGGMIGAGLMAADLAASSLTAPLDFARQSVSLAAEAEKTKAAFDVLVGSAEKADEVLGRLRKYAADSPLGSQTVIDTARNLAAVRVEADQLVPTMKMLGDIAGGDAERLRGVAKAYADVRTNGRLMGQELLQFANAGVPLLDELAKQAGKPKELMKPLIERGEVGSFAEVVKAMKGMTAEGGRFFGMSDKYAQTYAGSVEKLTDAWESLQREFGRAAIDELGLKDLAGGGAARLDQLRKEVDGLRPALRLAGEGVKGFVNLFAQLGAVGPSSQIGTLGALAAAVPGLSRTADALRDAFKALQDVRIDPVATGLGFYDAVGTAAVGVASLTDEFEKGAAVFDKNYIQPVRAFTAELAVAARVARGLANPVAGVADLAGSDVGRSAFQFVADARQAVGLGLAAQGKPALGAAVAGTQGTAPAADPGSQMHGGLWSQMEWMARNPPPPPSRADLTRERLRAGRPGVEARLGGVKGLLNPPPEAAAPPPVFGRDGLGLAALPAGGRADPFGALAGGLGLVQREADSTATALSAAAGGLAGFGVRADQVRVPTGLPGHLAAEAAGIKERYEAPADKLQKYDANLKQMVDAGAITPAERSRAFGDRTTDLLGRTPEVKLPPAAEHGTREFARMEAQLAAGGSNPGNDLPALMRASTEVSKEHLRVAENLLRQFEALIRNLGSPSECE